MMPPRFGRTSDPDPYHTILTRMHRVAVATQHCDLQRQAYGRVCDVPNQRKDRGGGGNHLVEPTRAPCVGVEADDPPPLSAACKCGRNMR